MDGIERHSCWDHTYEDCAAQVVVRLEARVVALTAALRALLNAADALAHYANLAVADHAIETARQALDAAAGP